MFGQSLPELFSEGAFAIVRILASIGAAFVGWFISDPMTRLLYRASMRAKTPTWLLPWAKLSGATLLALFVWFFLPLGGSGGLGWGTGSGGGPGRGAGKGGDKPSSLNSDVPRNQTPDNHKTAKPFDQKETLAIEILGGKRLQDAGDFRFYLLKRTEQAMNLKELDEYLQKNQAKIVVEIMQTDDSFVTNTEDDPTKQLRRLTSKYGIFVREPMLKSALP